VAARQERILGEVTFNRFAVSLSSARQTIETWSSIVSINWTTSLGCHCAAPGGSCRFNRAAISEVMARPGVRPPSSEACGILHPPGAASRGFFRASVVGCAGVCSLQRLRSIYVSKAISLTTALPGSISAIGMYHQSASFQHLTCSLRRRLSRRRSRHTPRSKGLRSPTGITGPPV
jgi:hypothetical protein